MDGFKNRLSGRYDRSEKNTTRDTRYDRSGDNRYERLTKKADSITIEAIAETIDKSNRAQLGLIANLIKENKTPDSNVSKAPTASPAASTGADKEILERLERMASQTNEALNENEDVLERTYDMLRAQTDLIVNLGNRNNYEKENEKVLEAISDNRTLLNLIRQELHSHDDQENPEGTKLFDTKAAEAKFNSLADHVHIQCVKTFRNVQANLNDQTTELTKQVKAANQNILIVAIASAALNFVTLVLIICEILKIFG